MDSSLPSPSLQFLMMSTRGVAVPRSKKNCALPIIRPLLRPLHIQDYVSFDQLMPVEILSSIFSFASHSACEPTSQSILTSHVCRKWRQISLSMPSLWNSIFLSLPLSKNQIARTITWMNRSRNHPLDIYMDFRDPSWDWDEVSHIFSSKAMDNMMRLLVPQASRWRSIELLTDTWAPIFTFLSCTLAIDSTPLLQSIRLARCNEYFVAQGETFRPANLAIPVAWFKGGSTLYHLRHVSLSGVHIDWSRSGLTGLRELELKYHARDVMPTLSEFRDILCANAGLERLVVLGWGPRIHDPLENERDDDPQAIHLPRLMDLEFGFVDVVYATDLLSLFAFPNLRILSVEDVAFGIQSFEYQDCSRLISHLAQMGAQGRISLASVRVLSLRCIRADDASVRCLFNRLDAVTSLCLDRVNAASLLAMCSALHECDPLETLTLKDIDSTASALMLVSNSLPPHIVVFLDIDDRASGDQSFDKAWSPVTVDVPLDR